MSSDDGMPMPPAGTGMVGDPDEYAMPGAGTQLGENPNKPERQEESDNRIWRMIRKFWKRMGKS